MVVSNQPQTLEISIAAVLNDPSASHWLKNAVKSSLERDPLDALQDAQLLAALMDIRLMSIEQAAAGANDGG